MAYSICPNSTFIVVQKIFLIINRAENISNNLILPNYLHHIVVAELASSLANGPRDSY